MRTIANLLFLLVAACTEDPNVAETSAAVDTDASGVVDCADLHHVLQCIHHADAAACAMADVNHDASVDDQDVHAIHQALAHAGHQCAPPEHHDGSGHHDPAHGADVDHPGHDQPGHTDAHDADGQHEPAVHHPS